MLRSPVCQVVEREREQIAPPLTWPKSVIAANGVLENTSPGYSRAVCASRPPEQVVGAPAVHRQVEGGVAPLFLCLLGQRTVP